MKVFIVGIAILVAGFYVLELGVLFDWTFTSTATVLGLVQGTIMGLFPFKEMMKG